MGAHPTKPPERVTVRPTIRDVAREAAVSISTVSRVLNDTCPVSPAKKKRVEDAVARLGYTPDPTARSLLKKVTGGVGVLVPSVSEEFFSEFLSGVDRFAQEHGYYLLISSSHRNRSEFDRALSSIYGRVDGLLVMAPDDGAYDAPFSPLQTMPVVYVNASDREGHDVVRVDNFCGFSAVTRHLIETGHRDIAMIMGPPGSFDAGERLRGFKAALEEAGITVRPEWLVPGDFTRESGYAAAEHILSLDHRPTAIAAANDLSALGALSALLDGGVALPESMALTGFDDVPSARFATPPLTTVRVPIRQLGIKAIAKLIGRIQNERDEEPALEVVPVETVVRASTALAGVKTNGRD